MTTLADATHKIVQIDTQRNRTTVALFSQPTKARQTFRSVFSNNHACYPVYVLVEIATGEEER